MLIARIVSTMNHRLAGELFNRWEIMSYLDLAVDRINARLNTTFPAFSELDSHTAEYDAFPDVYIRTVLITGAIMYFYQTDEEGATVAPEYTYQFEQELFYMERDYLPKLIADGSKYLADPVQGHLQMQNNHPLADYSWANVDPRGNIRWHKPKPPSTMQSPGIPVIAPASWPSKDDKPLEGDNPDWAPLRPQEDAEREAF